METLGLWILMGCSIQVVPGPGTYAAQCGASMNYPAPTLVTEAQCRLFTRKPKRERSRNHQVTYVCVSPDAKTIISQHGLEVLF